MQTLLSAEIALTIAICSSLAACFILAYGFKVWSDEKSAPKTDVGHGEFVAEVRVHINSYSEVVYRERHASVYSANRIAKLRAAEFKASPQGEKLAENAMIQTDTYKARQHDAASLYAIWPAAGTYLAFN